MNLIREHSPSSSSRFLGSNARAGREGTMYSADRPNSPHPPHSLTPELYDDCSATTYSYISAWSSNYTASNLPGPGRTLGNILSRAGSSLEQRLGKLAYRIGLGRYARAETLLVEYRLNEFLSGGDGGTRTKKKKKKQRGWDLLLGYLSSSNPTIQLMAFDYLIHNAIHIPAFRASAQKHCQKGQRELFDAFGFSWKRSGFTYTPLWRYHYNLASRCLLTRSDEVMEALERVDRLREGEVRLVGFECFVEALSCCRDILDTIIVIEHMASWWDCEGLDTYVRRNRSFSGSNNNNGTVAILRNIILAFRARYEVEVDSFPSPNTGIYNNGLGRNHDSEDPSSSVIITPIPWVAMLFVDGLWAALWTALLTGGVSTRDEDDDEAESPLVEEIWTEIFKLHCVSQTRAGKNLNRGLPQSYPTFWKKSWREVCFAELPSPSSSPVGGPNSIYFDEMRERLLLLEDVHGEAYRRRFPPGDE